MATSPLLFLSSFVAAIADGAAVGHLVPDHIGRCQFSAGFDPYFSWYCYSVEKVLKCECLSQLPVSDFMFVIGLLDIYLTLNGSWTNSGPEDPLGSFYKN